MIKGILTIAILVLTVLTVNTGFSTVYWVENAVTNTLTTNNMPPGFCSATISMANNKQFRIFLNTDINSQSWSGNNTILFTSYITNIARNDQGSSAYGKMTVDGGAGNHWSTLISSTNPSSVSQRFGVLTPEGTPSWFVSVSNSQTFVLSNTTVFITLDGLPLAKEAVLLRYSTNDWASSTEIIMASVLANSNFTAVIPGMLSGTTVSYYALTTTIAATNKLMTGPESDVDYMTLSASPRYSYYVHGTQHTIKIDGVNDFCTNFSEIFPTTTTGYTNYLTWDTSNFYIGYYGADLGSGNPNKILTAYFSTNSNTMGPGSAYGMSYNGQMPVLPFKAETMFYYMNGTWDSAGWTGNQWNFTTHPLNSGISLSNLGNFLEFSINKTNFASSVFLKTYLQLVDQSAGWTYGAVPSNTLSDGNDSNPSNFISFSDDMWLPNILPASNFYTNDAVVPNSNALIFPVNNTTNYDADALAVSNYSADDIGIYKINLYKTPAVLLNTAFVSNSNFIQTFSIPPSTLPVGTYQIYTVAYDTKNNSKPSLTNTLVVITNRPNVHWVENGNNFILTTNNMPGGYCKYTASITNSSFRIYMTSDANNTSWSSGNTINWNTASLIGMNRNDQGNASDGTMVPVAPNTLHTLISTTNPSGLNQKFGILYPNGIPSYIVMASNSLAGASAFAASNTTVFIKMNTNILPGEVVLVRYSTNNWVTASEKFASGVNSNYTAVIPGMPVNTALSYYVMTTTIGASNEVVTGSDANVNFLTLSYFDNNGSKFSYYVSGTPHTIVLDGVNDFCTDTSEVFPTTTSGYTNWMTWDANKFYIGYYGADIGALDPDKVLVIFFSTNSNTASGPGTAYGDWYSNQLTVLPFKADYIFNYYSTGTTSSALWDGTQWDWGSNPLNSGITINYTGANYLEMSINKTSFGSSRFLKVYVQFVNQSDLNPWVYGAVPYNTLIDDGLANPSNFISFNGNMWGTNIIPSSCITNDAEAPGSNDVLSIGYNFTNWADDPLEITNYCWDDIGIYKINFYKTPAVLMYTYYVTNSDSNQVFDVDPWTFTYGNYQVYTVAYDTKNAIYSRTNSLFINTNTTIYDSQVRWLYNGITYKLTTNNMPDGFAKATVAGGSKAYRIYYETNIPSQSWSGSNTLAFNQYITNIFRNDQGNSANGTTKADGKSPFMTLISSATPSGTSERFGTLTPWEVPEYFVSVSNNNINPFVWSLSNTKVFMSLNKAFSTNFQFVLLRYSTNNWATSTKLSAALISGSNYSAVIPGMPANTTVNYYAITTVKVVSNKIWTGPESDVNYLTLSASPIYSYYVHGTPHTVQIDGTNDFCTNYSEIFSTTKAGYTNWLTWDVSNFYIGYYGADVGANTTNKILVFYFSTNTNVNSTSGSAYGAWYNTQMPVLPFKADYVFNFITTNSWDSAKLNGTSWDWTTHPLNAGTTVAKLGNYVEISIKKTNFTSAPNLYYYAQFVNKAYGLEKTYGAVPGNSLADGYLANPSNFMIFTNRLWISNAVPADISAVKYDLTAPTSNLITFPGSSTTNYITNSVIITNYSKDETGIYKIYLYTNLNVLFKSFLVTNTNGACVLTIPPYSMVKGTNFLYTAAKDTRNSRFSGNTNVIYMLTNGIFMDLQKTVDRVVISNNNYSIPGSIIYYKIIYGNGGGAIVSNMVIYNIIPDGSTYFTNYMGTAAGWTAEFSQLDYPDQAYDSVDYNSTPDGAVWIRFKKVAVPAYETNKTIYFGVTVN